MSSIYDIVYDVARFWNEMIDKTMCSDLCPCTDADIFSGSYFSMPDSFLNKYQRTGVYSNQDADVPVYESIDYYVEKPLFTQTTLKQYLNTDVPSSSNVWSSIGDAVDSFGDESDVGEFTVDVPDDVVIGEDIDLDALLDSFGDFGDFGDGTDVFDSFGDVGDEGDVITSFGDGSDVGVVVDPDTVGLGDLLN